MKKIILLILVGYFTTLLNAQIASPRDTSNDIIFNNHKVLLDNQQKIISWITPQSKAYDQFLHMRWAFIKTRVPNSPGPPPRSSYPQYYFYCAFRENKGVLEPDLWMNDIGEKIPNWFENARLYYAYTGDSGVMKIIRDFVDYTIEHGTSPAEFAWPGFPYTTTNAGDTIFRGFTSAGRFVLNEIQVDHAGEMGLTYYRMYLYTGVKKYLTAALNVARILAKNARTGNKDQSVWPYRIVMDDGRVTAPYGANWTGCYMLFDNLIKANIGNVQTFKDARDKVRDFLLQYPMKTGYWTDGHTDTDIKSNTYKSNLSASNAALCLFDYPDLDPEWKSDIPRLIKWTEDNFVFRTAPGEPSTMWGANIAGEQDSFNFKMDYQTARYAAECARWYAVSGDESYKEKAFRSLNWVTYCNDSTGMAFESPVSKGILSWWSDCYGECPRMFYHAFAAVPEWAPLHENHILYSEGILRDVQYSAKELKYTATSGNGTEFLRLAFEPAQITANGVSIYKSEILKPDTWQLKDLGNGDYAITIRHQGACRIEILSSASKNQPQTGISCSGRIRKAPVLLLATNTDFGSYTAEILKTEGFNEFAVDSLGGEKVTSSYLSQFDLVIMAESKIDPGKLSMIREYVKNGGKLISILPDPELAEIFGIVPRSKSISNGYIRIDTTRIQGKGLTSRLLQFHGKADYYNLNGGASLAILLPEKVSGESYPAVVTNNYRKGHTVAFLYNLSQSIVLSRQGNPMFAGIEKDSIPGLRGMDLFTDGWLDRSNSTINQADEQMALLARCIENMMADSKPLPRFWYFPDTLKCLVTLTNDGEYKSESDFEPQFRDVDSMGAKMSLYILGVGKVSRTWVDKWTARGFEIAGHPDDTKQAKNPTWNSMDSALISRKQEIASYYGLPMLTNVNHWFVWCGRDTDGKQEFAAEAKLEEKNGIEMDINYAHYDINSNQGAHFLGPLGTNQGNFTGSGLVMKFADSKGKTINVYQHLNAVYDQEYNESHDPEGFFNCFKGLMDRSLHNEVSSFISIKSHNDEYYFSKSPLMKMLDYANHYNIPVWTELKLLDFIKMKDEASFTDISMVNNKLEFNINSSLKNSNSLTFMVPVKFKNLRVTGISVDGNEARFIIRSVKGSDYTMVMVEPGIKHSIIVNY